MGLRAQVKTISDGGGGGHESIIELILCQKLEGSSRLEDLRLSIFAEGPDFAVGKDRRSRILATDPILPDYLTSSGFQTCGNPGIIDHVDQIADQQDGRLVGNSSFHSPHDRTVFDKSVRFEPGSKKLTG